MHSAADEWADRLLKAIEDEIELVSEERARVKSAQIRVT